MVDKTGQRIPAILGLQRVEYERPPLIHEERVLWGIYCHAAADAGPRVVALWKTQARAAQYLRFAMASSWACDRCGTRFDRHRPLEASTFAEQRQRDVARPRAEELAPPSEAADLPPEGLTPAAVDRAGTAQAEAQRQEKATRRGPHAERLETARAVHEAAKQAMAKRPVKRDTPKDPFEDEVS
jgi:hypothetical protein